MQITFKLDGHRHLRTWGYFDLTASILRRWRGSTSDTYRHVTLGLRSPLVIYKDGVLARRVFWQRLRFGYGCGNLYLGLLFIVTTFGRQYPGLEYRTWGPFEWASPKQKGKL